MSRRSWLVRSVVLLAVGCLAAIVTIGVFLGRSVDPPDRSVVPGSNQASERGDFGLRVAVVGPLEPFSAVVGSSYMTAAQDLVFDTFLMPDEQGTLTSRVLRRWERIDGRHYRVQLDPNLRFSDGSPVSSQDAITSLTVVKLRGIARGEWLEIESLDPHQLVEPALLFTCLHKQTENGPLGTGPYRLVSQSPSVLAVERIRPLPGRIRRVEILAFPTPREVFAHILRGDVNAALGLDEHQLELIESNTSLKPIRSLAHNTLAVIFNHRRLNRAMRQQIAALLPLADIARVSGACHPEAFAKTPVQARELPPGPRLEVLVLQISTSMDRSALLIRRALGRRGGEIVLEDGSKILERWKTGAFDILIATIAVSPDPVPANLWRTGAPSNLSGYSNLRADAAFDRGDYAAAKAELAADLPYLPICRRERIGVVDSRIKNPRMGWWGLLDTMQDWEVEE